MENPASKSAEISTLDAATDIVIGYMADLAERGAISVVCRAWHKIDGCSREHVTIAFCYSATPHQLATRFPNRRSLKLMGKPRDAKLRFIPDDWWGGEGGGRICGSQPSLSCLKALHFRRMIVTDSDINVLVEAQGRIVESFVMTAV